MKREHHIARDNAEQDVYELQAGILSAYGAKEEQFAEVVLSQGYVLG